MAGSLLVVETESQEKEKAANTIKEQWQVHFARFINYPSLPSTYPTLVPLPKNRRYSAALGNWIATSSPAASLKIICDLSSSNAILVVCLSGKVLEEHYISKLHFSWPQIQCIPEFPARGSRAVFVSYEDSDNQIQKFAMRFSTHHEVESFMNALKEILNGGVQIEPLNADFGSQFSTQSEFISSNGLSSRACQELNDMTPADSYTPQMELSLSYEIEQHAFVQDAMLNHKSESIFPDFPPRFTSLLTDCCSAAEQAANQQHSFDQDAVLNHKSESIFPDFPPSFTSLLTDCCSADKQAANQPTVPAEIDLKSQIAKYMEDSSFQDMLSKVEKIISEVGADMLL